MRDERRQADGRRTRPGASAQPARSAARSRVRCQLAADRARGAASSSRLSRKRRRDRPATDPMGGVARPHGLGPTERPRSACSRLAAARRGECGGGSGSGRQVAPEQSRAYRRRRLPVGHHVVDAPDDCPRAILEGLDDNDRPPRPIAQQPFRHRPSDNLAQLPIPDRAVDGHLTDMPFTWKFGSSAHTDASRR